MTASAPIVMPPDDGSAEVARWYVLCDEHADDAQALFFVESDVEFADVALTVGKRSARPRR